MIKKIITKVAIFITFLSLSACADFLSSSGPNRSTVLLADGRSVPIIQVIQVNSELTQSILNNEKSLLFSEVFKEKKTLDQKIKPGDVLEVNIWEADPPILFSSGSQGQVGMSLPGSNKTTLPEQIVNTDGFISIPFAGKILAKDKNITEVENSILASLKARANQPQVMVRMIKNLTSQITIVGEVNSSALLSLTPKGERILDAIAAVGGVKQAVNKITVQLTRENIVQSISLDKIIQDSRQNIKLEPGDVLTIFFQPNSFTVLGATVKNDEVAFEGRGITLAQALGRVGGFNDNRADSKGLFIFRFEDPKSLNQKYKPEVLTSDGKAAIIYQVKMDDPATFFVAQNFPIKNKDVIYVANSPAAELQKFLNIIVSIVYPLISIDRLLGN
jgi:polysaccharide export outer membrane protein